MLYKVIECDCGEEIAPRRWDLGYRTCLECGEQEAKQRRKQQIRDLVDPQPVAKVKKNKLQSTQEVKADKPSVDTKELEQSIAYLENQRSKLMRAVDLRRQQADIQAQLAILEAQRKAELDDEESLLMLL